MGVRRSARQVAASRRNLAKARRKRNYAKANSAAKVRVTNYRGITYRTETSKTLLGTNHTTTAYKKNVLIGFADGGVSRRKKKAHIGKIDNVYVHAQYRGKKVSNQLVNHQLQALKGKSITVSTLRTDGGEKLVRRNPKLAKYATPRKEGRFVKSSNITSNMDYSYRVRAQDHALQYKKGRR